MIQYVDLGEDTLGKLISFNACHDPRGNACWSLIKIQWICTLFKGLASQRVIALCSVNTVLK